MITSFPPVQEGGKGAREERKMAVLDKVDDELYKLDGTVKLKSTGSSPPRVLGKPRDLLLPRAGERSWHADKERVRVE